VYSNVYEVRNHSCKEEMSAQQNSPSAHVPASGPRMQANTGPKDGKSSEPPQQHDR